MSVLLAVKEHVSWRNPITGRPRWFYLAMIAVLGGVLLLSRVGEPSDQLKVCLFRTVTGLPCMTCGMTRAFHAISHGHLREALAFHPLSLVFYGVTVFHLFWACLRLLGSRLCLVTRLQHPVRMMAAGAMVLLFVFWIPRLIGSALG
jgi:hypothetical protein